VSCLSTQGQANKWIRSMEAANKLQVLKPSTDPYYLRTLQVSVCVHDHLFAQKHVCVGRLAVHTNGIYRLSGITDLQTLNLK
jgi:hypothetical protein